MVVPDIPYTIHIFFRLAIIWLFLDRLPYLELDPGPWKHYPPSSPPSPNFSLFSGYFLAIFGLITIFGSPPPIKSNMKIVWPKEKLMKSSQGNEKQPLKSTDQQWKVVWKFYGKMKSHLQWKVIWNLCGKWKANEKHPTCNEKLPMKKCWLYSTRPLWGRP